MKKQTISPGTTSLVMVFSVICLTIFAVLSLLSAKNALNSAEKSALAMKERYAADAEAVCVMKAIAEGLPHGAALTESDGYISYSVPAGKGQELCVTLEKTLDGYRIDEWQLTDAGEWIPDDTLNVWNGEGT